MIRKSPCGVMSMLRRSSRNDSTFAHTIRAPVLLQPITGFWWSVWRWKLRHGIVRWKLSRGKCRDICGHGCAELQSRGLWGARCYSFSAGQWDIRLSCEEASSRVGLCCCTTMHVRILPGRHMTCCVSNYIETSSSILRIFRTWHLQTLSCFKKWRSILLVNASQLMKTWRMLVE